MNMPESLIDRLEQRFVRLERKLAIIWKDDPTVLASFQADFEGLVADLESGEIPQIHARGALNAIYDDHLPSESASGDFELNLPDRGARPVPGHGQFYRLVRPGVWKAIDYTDSKAYQEAESNRAIWLTYTAGARQGSGVLDRREKHAFNPTAQVQGAFCFVCGAPAQHPNHAA